MFDTPYGATPIDPSEAEGLKIKNISTRAQLDQFEAAGVSAGRLWLERRKGVDTLTDEFVRILHKKLFGAVWSWAGTYRNTEKNIGIDPSQVSVQVRLLMDDAKCWVENKTYDRLEFAARFHHRLVNIHPFPNGNGRHARIITNGILRNAMNEKPVVWGQGRLHVITDNEERRIYIDALRKGDEGDVRPLIEYLTSNES